MTYDNELTLIAQTIEDDGIGNQIPVEAETNILCGLKSIGRTEFYNAAANDLKPEMILVVHPYEYSGERYIKFSENESPKQRYSVIKTYKANMEDLELTCEKVIGNG